MTGGYFTGFKQELLQANNFTNLGFPIAEIEADGGLVITKEENSGGIITIQTVTAQLLYEIQGPLYYNSDVTARLNDVNLTQEGLHRVRVAGIAGLPPPPTTKGTSPSNIFASILSIQPVGITAKGGWQAEFHFFLTGLDIEEKAKMIELQTRESIGEYEKEFQTLKFTVTGSVPVNPRNQNEATVDLRIFAQSRNPDVMSAGKHKGVAPDAPSFAKWCIENCLQGYPGGTPAMDMRQAVGKPFFEYWVALFPQDLIQHEVHTFDGRVLSIFPPKATRVYPRQQDSYDTSAGFSLDCWGETIEAPLGYIAHGRSGDKSSDCNVGLFVRHDDEWDWLRSLLSISKIKELLGEEYQGGKIDRFELPNLVSTSILSQHGQELMDTRMLFIFCSKIIWIEVPIRLRAMTYWGRMWLSICEQNWYLYRKFSWIEGRYEHQLAGKVRIDSNTANLLTYCSGIRTSAVSARNLHHQKRRPNMMFDQQEKIHTVRNGRKCSSCNTHQTRPLISSPYLPPIHSQTVSNHPQILTMTSPKSYLKISLFLKKLDTITTSQFLAHWKGQHVNLALQNATFAAKTRKYNQVHITSELRKDAAVFGIPVMEYDGIAEVWVDSMKDWMEVVSDPEFVEKIAGEFC